MIRLVARFLTECLDVPCEDFRIRLNVYLNNGLTLEQIEDHWLEVVGVDRDCLGKHTINRLPASSAQRRTNRLRHGVCTLRVVRSTWLAQHVFGAIQENAGFDEPAWLDGKSPRVN
jgi:hypothetical protein